MRKISLAHLTMLEASPLDLVDAAAVAGFDAVGLRVVSPDPAQGMLPIVRGASLLAATKRRLAETQLAVLDIEAFWLTAATNVDQLVPGLRVGAELGARFVLAVGNDEDEGRTIENFARLCGRARDFGQVVMLEFIPFSQVRTLAAARAIVAAAGQSNGGVLVDALHLARSGGAPADLASVDRSLLHYAQVADAPRESPPAAELRAEARTRRLLPGEGDLPLRELIAALPTDAPLSVEAPTARLPALPFADRARVALAATQALLA